MSSENEKKLKICHVITRMIVGGAQENTLLTIVGHVQKGHDVTLVTGPSPGREGKLLENVEVPDFPQVVMPSLVRELSPFKDLKAVWELRRFFLQEKFDVVHTHSSKAGIAGRIAARLAHVPVVVHTVHGQAFHPYQKAWKNAFYIFSEWFAAKFCDRIYAVAQAMIDQCVKARVAPREKYQVVYSGMATDRFANAEAETELREKLAIPADSQLIVSVARLFPQKGYEYAVPAAIGLMKKYPRLHFLAVGDGPMYDSLHDEVRKAGLEDRFHFAGLVPPDQVQRYLALGAILWHLSLHEGLPRSVVQALATGIPAIGFRLDGTPEVVIDNETGFCTPPEDLDAVAKCTAYLLDHPDLAHQMGQNGRKKVLAQFDWHRMAGILESEYIRLYQAKTKQGGIA